MNQRGQGDGQSWRPVGGASRASYCHVLLKVETKNCILIDKCHQDDHMGNVKVPIAKKSHQSLGLLCICWGLKELKLGSCLLWNESYLPFSVYPQRFHLDIRSWCFFCINSPAFLSRVSPHAFCLCWIMLLPRPSGGYC